MAKNGMERKDTEEAIRTAAELAMERTGGAVRKDDQSGGESPTGFQLPQSVKFAVNQAAPPLPPDVAAALEKARKSGRYFVAVIHESDDDGGLESFCSRVGLNPDYLLRAWQEVARPIIDGSLAGNPIAGGKAG